MIQETCADLVVDQWERTREALQAFQNDDLTDEEGCELGEYGLSFDYVMKAINELSIQELEEIAAMAEKVEENTIDGEAEEVTDAEVVTDDEVSEILIPKRPKGPRQGDKDSEPPSMNPAFMGILKD